MRRLGCPAAPARGATHRPRTAWPDGARASGGGCARQLPGAVWAFPSPGAGRASGLFGRIRDEGRSWFGRWRQGPQMAGRLTRRRPPGCSGRCRRQPCEPMGLYSASGRSSRSLDALFAARTTRVHARARPESGRHPSRTRATDTRRVPAVGGAAPAPVLPPAARLLHTYRALGVLASTGADIALNWHESPGVG